MVEVLNRAGFVAAEVLPLSEVRREYERIDDLAAELRARRGRTILHRLSEGQIESYISFLCASSVDGFPVREAEPWTV